MNKKTLVLKLLKNQRVRRFAIRLLMNPRVRHAIFKQVTRQLLGRSR